MQEQQESIRQQLAESEREKCDLKSQLEEKTQILVDQNGKMQQINEEIGKLKAQNQLDLFEFKVDIVPEYPDMVEQLNDALHETNLLHKAAESNK